MHICSFGYLFNTLSQAIPPISTLPPSTPIAMISTVLILALAFIGQIHAAPLSAHNISSLADASPNSPACNDIHNCRTLASIIYSCLATIFACTWGSYHPDIPKRTHTPWRVCVAHFFLVLESFLAPEITVARAFLQRGEVCSYKRRFRSQYKGAY